MLTITHELRHLQRSVRASALAGCMALLLAGHASAAIVSGTFAGVLNDLGPFGPGMTPVPTYSNAAMTGSFRVDTSQIGLPEDVSITPDSYFAAYRLPLGAFEVKFTISGQSYVFGDSGGDTAVTLSDFPEGQYLMFGANFYQALEHSASFSFLGGPQAFMDGGDLRTLHPGPVDLSLTSFFFRLSPWVGAGGPLSRFEFDLPGVPEPAHWLMALAGLAVLAGSKVRQSQAHPALAVA